MPTLDLEYIIKLPAPSHDGPVSVEKALSTRLSVRTYTNATLAFNDALAKGVAL